MNKKQQQAYDRTVRKIRRHLGSPTFIAMLAHKLNGSVITGETVRTWILERRIPTDFAFVLYELMDYAIDPLTLAPELARFVELKAAPKAG